jgi:hypothetical protein
VLVPEKSKAIGPQVLDHLRQVRLQILSIRLERYVARGRKLPESVWQAAVELAREHGVYSVAHPLRLDYMGLKKRLGGVSHGRRKARKPTFVELIAPPSAMLRECLIEFESMRGSKVRIQWEAAASPDWMSPLRAWREAER